MASWGKMGVDGFFADLGVGDSHETTPKKAVIGGVKFTRSKNGNLWRDQFVRSSRSVCFYTLGMCVWGGVLMQADVGCDCNRMKIPRAKKDEPCKYFSTSGIHLPRFFWSWPANFITSLRHLQPSFFSTFSLGGCVLT